MRLWRTKIVWHGLLWCDFGPPPSPLEEWSMAPQGHNVMASGLMFSHATRVQILTNVFANCSMRIIYEIRASCQEPFHFLDLPSVRGVGPSCVKGWSMKRKG